ncbi:hypothetical protein ACFLS9_07770 [Bacteroidota bacterium]
MSSVTLIAIFVIVGIIFGFNCLFIAREKNRDPRVWFLLGLLFSVLALITLVGAPAKEKEEFIEPEESEKPERPGEAEQSKEVEKKD